MSAGWEVGDLALCVLVGPIPIDERGFWQGTDCPPRGMISRVVDIRPALRNNGKATGEIALYLESGHSGVSRRFRKINPENEPCEEEFAALIKRGCKVGANA